MYIRLGIKRDMLHPPPIPDQTEIQPAMPENTPTILTPERQPPPLCTYVCSADTRRCTRVLLKVQSVDTGRPLAIDALLDSGATGMFIDIEYVRAKRLKTHYCHDFPIPFPITCCLGSATP